MDDAQSGDDAQRPTPDKGLDVPTTLDSLPRPAARGDGSGGRPSRTGTADVRGAKRDKEQPRKWTVGAAGSSRHDAPRRTSQARRKGNARR
ncbi:hypothetical protein B0H17DRAFT_1104399 [Mycena rosella]|uniref:Uncharacterized protein n=1 Tax=Mycena rosella TaxID=1033263 RepID=A0AAD7CCS6_MYCRO|nr:hypothetical protein B0H17DRAFT_1104399 [Mycena rosella]